MRDVTADKRSQTAVSSESIKALQDLIDELPESLLVEILCRLPAKTIIQCKGVSKYWSTLISRPCFNNYFLSLQKQDLALESSLMFVRTAGRHETEFFINSKQYGEKLRFLQKFKVVSGTCNDLVLCCATPIFQRCYFICNPYTKQWVSLPPTPQCHQEYVHVGFLCDSYHRCKVVRILKCEVEPAFQFKVEFFYSESCEWSESLVACPQGLTYDDIRSSVDRVAIAYDGRLYWLGHGGFLIYLDPSEFDSSSCIHSTTAATSPGNHCGFIPKPDVDLSAYSSCEQCLSVCSGRLSLCQIYKGSSSSAIYSWNLKEDDHDQVGGVGGKMVKWCLRKRVVLDKWMFSINWKPLALDPNNKDIMHALGQSNPLNEEDYLFRCKLNFQKFTGAIRSWIEIILLQNRIEAFPLVIPCLRLPTPVPRIEYHSKICKALPFQAKFEVPFKYWNI